jgi:serine/threonine protein kinase
VLSAVHTRGIVHRDLKPDNLLLTPADPYPVRVIDWGVARLGPVGRITIEGLTPGTPIYMSPEQAAGKHIAAPCDIYSLGVIAYEALTGHPPFDGRTLAEVVCKHMTTEPDALDVCTNAPPALCDLVHVMLDKTASRRPMAVEVRHEAQAIVREQHAVAPEQIAVARTTTLDYEELEYGVTELLPTMRKPRWTPEIARQPITPKSIRDQVAGEIVARRR